MARIKNSVADNKPRAPFGVKVERFLHIGYHPRLEVRLGTDNLPHIYPGCYDSNKPKKTVLKVQSWKKKLEMEEFSRRLGYNGDHIIKRLQWFNSVNGPGWQDVPEQSLKTGITFPKAPRHPASKFKACAVPGPGSYGKNHVPHIRKEEKSHGKGFSFSTLPSFDQSSKAPRSISQQKSYHLPPNLYKIKSFTDEMMSKRISKRGPYDLFTGERFPDPIVSKLSLLRGRIHPSDLNHPKNAFKGVFQRCGKDSQITSRLVVTVLSAAKKNPSDPGPCTYNPYPTPVVSQKVAPFNSSSREARPRIKCGLTAPPGRYNQDLKKHIIGDGMRSAFLSKVKRCQLQRDKTSFFE